MKVEVKELKISNELQKKINMICRFAGVSYAFSSGGVKNIKGYWNMSYGYDFNDRDMWEGQILLQDDGWFEGIVVDSSSSYIEDRFIFGVYYPEKVVELFKFTPLSVSALFVFHGRRDAKGI